jgi:hypothetical protein
VATSSAVNSSPTTNGIEYNPHLDFVAPMAPSMWLPNNGALSWWDSDLGPDGTQFDLQVSTDPAVSGSAALASWRDLRFEAWHAVLSPDVGPIGIDTAYRSPFLTQPAVLNDGDLQAAFHFEKLRDAGTWWVLLTGTGPDGRRYRLMDAGGMTMFNGSAWDWLTAPQ